MMDRAWRAYHSGLPVEPGETIRLDAAESHHVHRVLRLRRGDAVRVFDGRGREWSGTIEGGGPEGVNVRLEAEVDRIVEAPVEVVLFQGLCRSDRMEWVIQKATEIGVSVLHPFTCEKSDTRPPSPTRLERWRRIAIEACKQSGRLEVPEIRPLEALPPPAAGKTAILLDAGARSRALDGLLRGPADPGVWVAVGPESGFSSAEIAGWEEKGWQSAHLGPRTLRTETAGLVAAAIVLHRWGDLGRGAGTAAGFGPTG